MLDDETDIDSDLLRDKVLVGADRSFVNLLPCILVTACDRAQISVVRLRSPTDIRRPRPTLSGYL